MIKRRNWLAVLLILAFIMGMLPAGNPPTYAGTGDEAVQKSGALTAAVPDVVGMTDKEAAAAIKAAGFALGEVKDDFNDSLPAGKVISQNPAAGKELEAGSAVDLTVSLGPTPVKPDEPAVEPDKKAAAVPDVVGMTDKEAAAAIKAAGLAVGDVGEKNDEATPAGKVISQEPAAGKEVEVGSSVTLTVSLGPADVKPDEPPVEPDKKAAAVPDVVGMTDKDAAAAIKAAGFALGEIKEDFNDSLPPGKVISQNPAAGKELEAGSAVDLVVSKGTAPVMAMALLSTGSGIIYVKHDAAGAGTGTSWTDAYTSLSAALGTAQSGDEIWVAAGTYKPTTGTDRAASFQMKNGMAIYGGFNGTETLRSQRDWEANKTILSGDIGAVGDNSDNCYHVFNHPETLNLDSTAILDGFTITRGQADGASPHNGGGGMYNNHNSPTLNNIIFLNNTAGGFGGGGLRNINGSSPTLTNVTFSGNSSGSGGGGMLNQEGSPVLQNIKFINNSASDGGGGMLNFDGSPSMTDVVFSGNHADNNGGGMCNDEYLSHLTLNRIVFRDNTARKGGGLANNHSDSALTNIVFDGNSAVLDGGGMANLTGGSTTLTNVTFSGNSCSDPENEDNGGGALYNGLSSSLTMTNSILWGNSAEQGPEILKTATSTSTNISYSLIQGCGGSGAGWAAAIGTDGGNNLDAAPLFVNAAADDLHLQAASPAINKGNNDALLAGVTTDLDGSSRISGGTVDMGAYEYQGAVEPPALVYRSNPQVAYCGAANGFLVVWQEQTSDGKNIVAGQRLDLDGALQGDAVVIAGPSDVPLIWTAVAYDDVNQVYLVVWEDIRGYNADPVTLCDIRGRFVDAGTGQVRGSEFPVCDDGDDSHYPDVAFNAPSGNFMVVWHENTTVDLNNYYRLVRFNTATNQGDLLGTDKTLIGDDAGISDDSQADPNVTGDGIGSRFFLAWDDDRDGDYLSSVYGRFIDAVTGDIMGSEDIIVQTSPDRQHFSLAVAGGDGKVYVSWEDANEVTAPDYEFHSRISGRYVDAGTMNPVNGGFTVADDPGNEGQPSNAYNSNYQGYFSAYVYEDSSVDLRFEAVPEGTPSGLSGMTVTGTPVSSEIGDKEGPSTVYDPDRNRYFVVYAAKLIGEFEGWPKPSNIYGVFVDSQGSRIASDIEVVSGEYSDPVQSLYTLTLQVSPAAGGTATNNSSAGPYSAGDVVNVTAAANTGYEFVNWTVDGVSVSTSPTFDFKMPMRNVSLVANFNATSIPDLEPATNLSASDPDNTFAGVDGRDFHITWTPSVSSGVTSQKIYILPAAVIIDSSSQTPVATFNDNTTSSWTGEAALTMDSASGTLAAGDYRIYVLVTREPNKIQSSTALTAVSEASTPTYDIIYVKQGAAGANNGTSWTDAFTTLRAALDVATAGKQIWVAAGTYTPTDVNDRSKSFQMKNGIAIYGGFAGEEAPDYDLDGRDFTAHETVLSGDIGKNDVISEGAISNNGENSYHVFCHSELNLDSSAVLDGFTISGGNANGTENIDKPGGGMYNYMSSPCLRNLIFRYNSASTFGGGMFNQLNSPSLSGVTFNNNQAQCGAGMFNAEGGNPTLTDLAFNNNTAALNGGGMQNENNNITINGAVFNNNRAVMGAGIHDWNDVQKPGARVLNNVSFNSNISTSDGGGMYTTQVGFTLNNVTFNGNSSGKWGGGLFIFDCPMSTLNSTTFDSNTASEYGGGIYNFSGSLTLEDVTFRNNRAQLHGGGFHNYMSPSLVLKDAVFDQNQTQENGGGMYSIRCNPSVANVTFSGNSAKNGGGVCCDESDATAFTNVVFKGNTAFEDGGGIYNDLSSPALTNVTFNGNTAKNGGGMRNHGSGSVIANCLLWDNSADLAGDQILSTKTSPTSTYFPTISHSLIEGCGGSGAGWDSSLGNDGGNNIAAKPRFVDADAGDLHLKGISPAIDAGNDAAVPVGVTTDLDKNDRISNGTVDMGAYEYQGPPIPTYTLTLEANPAAGGTVTDTTNDGPYPADETVNVTAAAKSGYRFVNWTVDGDPVSTAATFEYTMPAGNVTLVANFRTDDDTPAAPTISPPGGTYPDSVVVTITGSSGQIYYTTDGSDPTSSGTKIQYLGSFTLTSSATVKAAIHGYNSGWSSIASVSYIITHSPIQAPVIGPSGDTYPYSVEVTITGSGGTIYYTIDGGDPRTNGIVYSGPFTLTSSATVKAATQGESGWSEVVSETYTISSPENPVPEFVPNGGPFSGSVKVKINRIGGDSQVPGFYTIFYTTDGSDPKDSGSVYNGEITLTQTTTVKARIRIAELVLDSADAGGGGGGPNPEQYIWSEIVSATFTKNSSGGGGGPSGGGGVSTPKPKEEVTPPVEPEVTVPTVAEPTDLKGHWSHDCVMALLNHGIIKGYPDGTIRPENEITRAEAAVLLVSALGLQEYQPQIVDNPYQDGIPDWARQAILTATEKKLMKGYPDGTFQPDRKITRAEMCAALMQAFPKTTPAGFVLAFTDAESVPEWAGPFVKAAVSNGVVSGYPDSTFQPGNNIKRGEAFSIICRLMGFHGLEHK